ncbi:MAG: GNAT family N-acetyltransferase, partial [Alphaproteobacteria bacterium]
SPAVEVGWRIARPFWGQGYAPEAAAASAAAFLFRSRRIGGRSTEPVPQHCPDLRGAQSLPRGSAVRPPGPGLRCRGSAHATGSAT